MGHWGLHSRANCSSRGGVYGCKKETSIFLTFFKNVREICVLLLSVSAVEECCHPEQMWHTAYRPQIPTFQTKACCIYSTLWSGDTPDDQAPSIQVPSPDGRAWPARAQHLRIVRPQRRGTAGCSTCMQAISMMQRCGGIFLVIV